MYELHPLCSLFPRIHGPEFAGLVSDIKANGQREPIILHDGMILDGGNRYRACLEAGVEPSFMKFGGDNIVSFVLSANLHRRHLTAGQHAAIVASVTNWAAVQKVGNPQFGNVAGLQTVAERAAISGASDRTQRDADKVAKADPDLAVAVGRGTVTLAKAKAQVEGKSRKPKERLYVAPQTEEDGPSAEEIAEAEQSAADDSEAIRILLESDDKLAAMTAKCKQQAAQIRILESRITGLINECAEHVRSIKRMRRQLERVPA